ncbi:MAG: MbnP family protein [Bacteroidota bacterium]
MKKIFSATAIILACTTLLFTSCKKDKSEEPTPSTEQNLTMHLHSNVGTHAANFDSIFTNNAGQRYTIDDYRMYISNIVLIKSDGSELPVSGKVFLTNPESDEYDLGMVPVGNYKGFKFLLGLDSAINHSDPSTYPSSSPLSVQTPSIHWSWSSGYIFWKVEGKVDTTVAQSGPIDVDFLYHIGMDQFSRTIDFSTEAFSVVSGQDQLIHLNFDLNAALSNVDMTSELMTHTMDDMMLATKIANNWQSAFEVE